MVVLLVRWVPAVTVLDCDRRQLAHGRHGGVRGAAPRSGAIVVSDVGLQGIYIYVCGMNIDMDIRDFAGCLRFARRRWEVHEGWAAGHGGGGGGGDIVHGR